MAYHLVGNVDSEHLARVAKLPKHSLLTIMMVMVKMPIFTIMKMPMVVMMMKIRSNLCHCYCCFPSAAAKVKQTISCPKT